MSVETSIIVRTLNEGKYLERLLTGIRQQSYSDWEIILVDSGSTDGTLEIASKYVEKIHHIPKEEFTFGRSLNMGCQIAEARYLVLVSAHTYPPNNNWLSNLLEPFEDPTIGMVYGRQRGLGSSHIAEERDLERQFGSTSVVMVDRPAGHNGNAAIRRDLWLEEPFDESLTGLEDIDWARKVQRRGFRVHYAADAAVYHIHEESARKIYRRFLREGIAFKRIFPGSRFSGLDLVKNLLRSVAGDLLYGLQYRKSIRKLLEIPPMRLAEFLGTYHGIRSHRRRRQELRAQVGFPQSSEGVVIDGPGQHSLRTRDVPKAGDDDVLVKVAYVGICATDLEVTHGSLEYYRSGRAQYPVVPGHEYSGVIVGTGAKVDGFKPGDGIVGECAIGCGTCRWCASEEYYRCPHRKEVGVINMDGAYARYMVLPAQYVHKIPEDLFLRNAALIEPVAVCVKGLRKLSPEAGGRACVIGAGPIGNLCTQILRSRDIEVAVVDEDDQRLKLVQKYNVDTLKMLGDLSSFDYLIEASGNEEVIPALIEGSRPSARVVLLGLPYTRPVQVVFSSVPCFDKEIYGSIASQKADWEEAIALVRDGVINLEDHVGMVLPLEAYESAWDLHRKREHLKVLLSVNEDLGAL